VPTAQYNPTGGCYVDFTGTFQENDYVRFGVVNSVTEYAALIFTLPTDIKGAAVHSASLTLYSSSFSLHVDPHESIIRAVADDTPTLPTSKAELDALVAGSKTTAYSTLSATSPWVINGPYTFLDLGPAISEISGRTGFVDTVVFLIEDNGCAFNAGFSGYLTHASYAPVLSISYGVINKVDEDRPMVTGQGYGGATGAAERPMMIPWMRDYKFSGRRPMITGKITTSDSTVYATVDAERPMITGTITQAYYGEVNAERPMITGAGEGNISDAVFDADRPMITGLGYSGGVLNEKRPMITAVAAASSEITGSADEDRPMITGAITTTDGIELDFDGTRPMIEMVARATFGILVTFDQDRPMITGEIEANDDQLEIEVDEDRPMIEGRIEASGPGSCAVLSYGG
jgi:hypothetical protein